MKIESIRSLHGPNVYSYRPVLLMSLDLGELVERESREFTGFNDRLLTLLPGIQNHHCSLGRPGGFVTRLEEGTYFGHIVEHVALELTELTGIGKSHGQTRHDTGSVYNVAIEFRAEKASTYLLQQAVKLVEALVRDKSFQVQPVLEEAKRLVSDADVGPTTRAITQAAGLCTRASWEDLCAVQWRQNVAEEDLKKTLSIYNVTMHMLSQGDRFDLIKRLPRQMKGRAAEKLPEKEEEAQPA